MTEVPMADGIGGLVVSGKFFNRLPKDLQELLLRTGQRSQRETAGLKPARTTKKSLGVLKQNGVTFTPGMEGYQGADVISIRDRAARRLGQEWLHPADVYDRARKSLAEYREKKGQTTMSNHARKRSLPSRIEQTLDAAQNAGCQRLPGSKYWFFR